jgi:hypothetical protein
MKIINKRVMLFVHPKIDNFWDNPHFSITTKKKREEERENKNTMRVCERELSKVVHFLVVQISLLIAK